MKMFYLLLLLFIGSFDPISACYCKPSDRINLQLLENSGTLTKSITDKLGDSRLD